MVRAGYRIMLPTAILGDDVQLDEYVAKIAEDMPRLADGFDPLQHETVPDTAETRWIAVRLPRVDDFGGTVEPERSELWERGTPLPDWAEGAVLMVVVEIRTKGEGC